MAPPPYSTHEQRAAINRERRYRDYLNQTAPLFNLLARAESTEIRSLIIDKDGRVEYGPYSERHQRFRRQVYEAVESIWRRCFPE